jgi:hypothetical protein
MSMNAPEQADVPTVHAIPRRSVALGLVLAAIVLLTGLVVIRNHTVGDQPADAEVFTPAPGSLVQSTTQVLASVFNAVGVSSPANPVAPPSPTGKSPLWTASEGGVASLPVVYFYGAEFAPYAASERWAVVVALSRFGTFTQLGLMQSSASVAFPDLSTFTFAHVAYASDLVDLQTIERYGSQDLTGAGYTSFQKPSTRQAAAVSDYDPSGSTFPLLDIANRFTLLGSSYTPSVLAGLSQSQIAADLAYPQSPVAQAVIASANEISAAICTVTGQLPTAVCDGRGVTEADLRMRIKPAR